MRCTLVQLPIFGSSQAPGNFRGPAEPAKAKPVWPGRNTTRISLASLSNPSLLHLFHPYSTSDNDGLRVCGSLNLQIKLGTPGTIETRSLKRPWMAVSRAWSDVHLCRADSPILFLVRYHVIKRPASQYVASSCSSAQMYAFALPLNIILRNWYKYAHKLTTDSHVNSHFMTSAVCSLLTGLILSLSSRKVSETFEANIFFCFSTL